MSLSHTSQPEEFGFFHWYDLFYRGESMNSVHAGVGTIYRYLVEGDRFDGVRLDGYEPEEAIIGARIVAAGLLGPFASHVFERFGYSITEIERLWQPSSPTSPPRMSSWRPSRSAPIASGP